MELAKVRQTKGIDETKEIKGVEVHVSEDFYITVARAGNPVAVRTIEELSDTPEVNALRRSGLMTKKQREEIFKKSLARAVLVGWRGLTKDGKDVPYSVEMSEELLGMQDIYDLVCEVSVKHDYYREEAVKAAADTLGK